MILHLSTIAGDTIANTVHSIEGPPVTPEKVKGDESVTLPETPEKIDSSVKVCRLSTMNVDERDACVEL